MPKETKTNNSPALNLRQKKFLEAYMLHGNATQAAITAGYSDKTAGQIGARLIKHVNIVGEIARINQKTTEQTEVNAAWVTERLVKVAERCMQAEPVMEKVDGSWVRTGEFQFNAAGANKALELLGKTQAMFKEVGSIENPLVVDSDIEIRFTAED